MSHLPWKIDEALESAPAWAHLSLKAFADKISHDFPCIFAASSIPELAFVDPDDPAWLDQVVAAVDSYLDGIKGLSKIEISRRVLGVWIRPAGHETEDDFRRQAWGIVQHLHDSDSEDWPPLEPVDPESKFWSFCYRGEPLFLNASAPSNVLRKSRQFGDCMVLLIQTRAGIDVQVSPWKKGNRIRALIRKNLESYDEAPPLRMMGPTGCVTTRDWRIFFIPDDESRLEKKCPLRMRDRRPNG